MHSLTTALTLSLTIHVRLSCRLLVDAKKLKSLRVSHNRLVALPAEVESVGLEELHIQHNLVSRLPNELFSKLNKYVPPVVSAQRALQQAQQVRATC